MKPANRAELLVELKKLKPLTKPHHSWPMQKNLLDDTETLTEVVRLTKSVGLSSIYNVREDIEKAAPALENNKDASICYSMSPWHYEFKKDEPSTWDDSAVNEIYNLRGSWHLHEPEHSSNHF